MASEKRRLVLPAPPPPSKKPVLRLLDQNGGVNSVTAAQLRGADGGDHPAEQHQQPGDLEGTDDEAEDLVGLPNDTQAALLLLKQQFTAKGGVLPFALKSQLYSLVRDRTLVDRQVDELRLRNEVRMFQLPTGSDDFALMLTADYAAALQASMQALAPSKGAAADVFDWFRERVLPACCELMITHGELLALLGGRGRPCSAAPAAAGAAAARAAATARGALQSARAGAAAGGAALPSAAAPPAVGEPHVSLLLSQGFLTRHSGGLDGYLFSMPGAGPAVRSIREGRADIVQALQRRRYPEIPEKELENRKLQRSVLGVRFHVRDMLGSGALLRLDTTVGPVLRLPQKK